MVPSARPLVALSAALLALAAHPALADAPAPAQPPSPTFEALKALAGEWRGTARAAGSEQTFDTRAVIKVVSGGSAVMLVTDPDTGHEMVTMFHRDDADVLATHYCGAQNQPRMRARPGATAGEVAFDFMDGTNLKAFPGRMQSLVLRMADATHHVQTWTHRAGEKDATMTIDLVRVK